MIVEQVQKITTFYEAKPNTWPEGVVVVVEDHGGQGHGGQGVVVVAVDHGVQEEEEAAGHTGLALEHLK